MIVRLILITIFAIIAINNISKYLEIKIKATIEKNHMIAFIIMLILLVIAFVVIFEQNLANLGLALVFIIYYISGVLARGIGKKGVIDKTSFLARTQIINWQYIKEMKFEYPTDDHVDVVFVTNSKAIRQSYDDIHEKTLLKIKKELKL